MKYTTPALINNTKRLKGARAFFFGQGGIANYYRARHKSEDVLVMWIEASQFGKMQCFPCVLEEQGDPMVFEVVKGLNAKMRNADLIKRWPLFVTPANIHEEFELEEMEKKEFYEIFGEYRQRAVQREIEKEYIKQGKTPEEARYLAENPEAAAAEQDEREKGGKAELAAAEVEAQAGTKDEQAAADGFEPASPDEDKR